MPMPTTGLIVNHETASSSSVRSRKPAYCGISDSDKSEVLIRANGSVSNSRIEVDFPQEQADLADTFP